MKRTGIFAATAAGAIGATALVGGVGYTLAQDVAEQSGAPLDLGAVASVEPGQGELPTATRLHADDDTDGAASDEAPADDTSGTDSDAGGAAPVAPAPPVAIDPGTKAAHGQHPWPRDGQAARGDHDPRTGTDPRDGRHDGGDQHNWNDRDGGGRDDGHDGRYGGGDGGGHHGGGGYGGHH